MSCTCTNDKSYVICFYEDEILYDRRDCMSCVCFDVGLSACSSACYCGPDFGGCCLEVPWVSACEGCADCCAILPLAGSSVGFFGRNACRVSNLESVILYEPTCSESKCSWYLAGRFFSVVYATGLEWPLVYSLVSARNQAVNFAEPKAFCE